MDLTPFQKAKKNAIDAGFDADKVESLRSQREVEELMASGKPNGGFPQPPARTEPGSARKEADGPRFEVVHHKNRTINVVKDS